MTLDGLDEAIIALVVGDPRISVRALAERLSVAESTVRARLKGLVDSGRVRASVVVHPSVEDHRFLYLTRLRLADPASGVPAGPVLSDAPWVVRGTSLPVLLVQRAARTFEEVVEGIDAFARLPDVEEATHTFFIRLFVGSNWSNVARTPQGWTLLPDRQFDAVDRVLIEQLRLDGRTSYTSLARRVDLTVAATRRRVLRLVEARAIRFVTRVLPPTRHEIAAHVDLTVSPKEVLPLAEELCALTTVRYVAQQTGSYNLACHVVATTTSDLTSAVAAITGDHRVRAHDVVPIATVRDQLSWVPESFS